MIGIFERQYTAGHPLTVVSPGTQTRDFTHISDIVDALILLKGAPKGDGYCIGTGQSYKIDQVAKMFGDNVVYLDERPGERFKTGIDLTKMGALGWNATVSLENYIEELKENKK